MSWFRLEGRGAFHHKVLAAGNEAYGAWCRAGQWCSDQLTDGLVPRPVAEQIAKPKVWAKLVEVRLMDEAEGGYQIHDYLDWNPSSEQEREKREAMREKRREAGRAGGKRSGEVRRGEAEEKHDGSKHEANAKHFASTGASPGTKQNEAPSPSPSPSPSGSSEEEPPNPPQAGGSGVAVPFQPSEPTAGGHPLLTGKGPVLCFALESPAPAPKVRKRTGATPATEAYSGAYQSGHADAGGTVSRPTGADAKTLGRAAATHARGPDGEPLKGDAVLAWIRERAADFRRAVQDPEHHRGGYSPFGFLAWLDNGARHQRGGRPQDIQQRGAVPGSLGY